MKIKLLYFFIMAFVCFYAEAQVLNQQANWPDTNWSLTGTFDPAFIDENPTTNPAMPTIATIPIKSSFLPFILFYKFTAFPN